MSAQKAPTDYDGPSTRPAKVVAGRGAAEPGTNPDPGRFIEVNGVSLYVEEHGAGVPVLLMHGWPDSARLWRNQVPFLVSNGFRVITPDMRGFGRSGRPQEAAAYRLQNVVADVTGLLDALGIEAAHVVGHDWGAAVAWLTATLAPDRVRRLVAISVPHPLAPVTLRQHEMAWYQLFRTPLRQRAARHTEYATQGNGTSMSVRHALLALLGEGPDPSTVSSCAKSSSRGPSGCGP